MAGGEDPGDGRKVALKLCELFSLKMRLNSAVVFVVLCKS